METNLRQAETKIKIEGILSSKKLEMGKDKNGNDCIKGSLMIKVDELNTIPVNVYAGEKTSKGEINKAWAGINTVMNEYKSIADVGEENADRVYTAASFNTYKNQNGVDVTNYKSSFFTRVSGNLNPKREFETEGFVKSKMPEYNKDGEETGRIKLKLIAPDYAGINILELIAPEDIANDVDAGIEIGRTYQFYGEIVNSRVEKQIPMKIGKPKIETIFKNELIMTGAGEEYPEEKEYNKDTIELAIQEYENMQNSKKDKEENPYTKPTAAGTGRSLNF